jgi:hypothetical protein
MEPNAAPVIPRYELAPPTEGDAMSMLARALGVERAAEAWLAACRAAGVRTGRGELAPEQVLAAAEALAKGGDRVAGVVGTSLAVRAKTYLLLRKTRPQGGS